MEPGHGSPGQRFWPGRIGSRVNMSCPVFDPVLSFNMRVYRGSFYRLTPSRQTNHSTAVFFKSTDSDNLLMLATKRFGFPDSRCRGFISQRSTTGSGHGSKILTRFLSGSDSG